MDAEITEQGGADQNGYAVSRYNALRHGILSRHTILPWENQSDYDKLLDSLETEYQPATPTESHLVAELAGIMWRKARICMAESSAFRKEASHQINTLSLGTPDYVREALVTTSAEIKSLRNGVNNLADDVTDAEAHKAKEYLAYWEQQQCHFQTNGRAATIALLDDNTKAAWAEHRTGAIQYRQKMGYEQLSDDKLFADWLEECASHFHEKVMGHQYAPSIRQQIIGLSYATGRMDGIARYETHLDRKFERVLAMLLKLKEMNRLKGKAAN